MPCGSKGAGQPFPLCNCHRREKHVQLLLRSQLHSGQRWVELGTCSKTISLTLFRHRNSACKRITTKTLKASFHVASKIFTATHYMTALQSDKQWFIKGWLPCGNENSISRLFTPHYAYNPRANLLLRGDLSLLPGFVTSYNGNLEHIGLLGSSKCWHRITFINITTNVIRKVSEYCQTRGRGSNSSKILGFPLENFHFIIGNRYMFYPKVTNSLCSFLETAPANCPHLNNQANVHPSKANE